MSIVLTVDDSKLICETIEGILRNEENVTVISVYTGEQALESIRKKVPDVILLDVVLPDANGYDICKLLKQEWNLKEVPIIFLTAQNDVQSVVKGFEAGAVDYICKPFSQVELKARVLNHLQKKRMTDKLHDLERVKEEFRLQGLKDPLTNVYNRRFFLENMPIWRKSAQQGRKISFLMSDIDDFKLVNDVYGHFAGDYVLYTITDIMVKEVGKKGVVGRWGGEEFLITLFDTDVYQAKEIAERIRKAVDCYDFCYDEKQIHCSLTFGIVQCNANVDINKNLLAVDKALYQGKRSGKNCCIIGQVLS